MATHPLGVPVLPDVKKTCETRSGWRSRQASRSRSASAEARCVSPVGVSPRRRAPPSSPQASPSSKAPTSNTSERRKTSTLSRRASPRVSFLFSYATCSWRFASSPSVSVSASFPSVPNERRGPSRVLVSSASTMPCATFASSSSTTITETAAARAAAADRVGGSCFESGTNAHPHRPTANISNRKPGPSDTNTPTQCARCSGDVCSGLKRGGSSPRARTARHNFAAAAAAAR